MAGTILLSRGTAPNESGIATLTISNPGKLNAIDLSMWRQMKASLDELAADPDLRCLRVRGDAPEGQPPAFAAGGDLEEFLQVRMNVDDAMAYHEAAVAPALTALADFPVPVLAEIDGPCIGGGLEIACCCDIRLASDQSSVGAPILKVGFNMYAGELAQVLSVTGAAVVSEILLEGRIYDSGEAYAKGLLSRVVPRARLAAESQASCQRIAQGAPLVARAHKQWIRRLRSGHMPSIDEKRESLRLVDSADYREGLDAFLAKRRPVFHSR